MKYQTISAAVACLLTTGCASIVNGSNQTLSVRTTKGPDAVAGAHCELTSNKGVWYVATPGTVTVNRGYDDLNLKCSKEGMEPGLATVKSSTKSMAFGNIIFGGVIGAAVDMGTGAAYDYPSLITVAMGDSVLIQPPATQKNSEQASSPSAATVAVGATTPAVEESVK